MTFSRNRVVSTAGASVGAVVVLAHVVAAIGFGMAASDWIDGTAIGAVLIIVALAHVFVPHGAAASAASAGSAPSVTTRQLLAWVLPVVVGVPAGALLALVFPWVRWAVVAAFAVMVLTVGRRTAGSFLAKGLLLAGFGAVTAFTFLCLASDLPGTLDPNLLTRVKVSLSFGVFAIVIGALAHLVVSAHTTEAAPAADPAEVRC